MNSARSKYKTSKLMNQTNKQIIIIFFVQIILASIGAIIGSQWMVKNLDNPYLDFNS